LGFAFFKNFFCEIFILPFQLKHLIMTALRCSFSFDGFGEPQFYFVWKSIWSFITFPIGLNRTFINNPDQQQVRTEVKLGQQKWVQRTPPHKRNLIEHLFEEYLFVLFTHLLVHLFVLRVGFQHELDLAAVFELGVFPLRPNAVLGHLQRSHVHVLATCIRVGWRVSEVHLHLLVLLEVGHVCDRIHQHGELFGQCHLVVECGEWHNLFETGWKVEWFAEFIAVHLLQPHCKLAHFDGLLALVFIRPALQCLNFG